jgi:hypothetical protein
MPTYSWTELREAATRRAGVTNGSQVRSREETERVAEEKDWNLLFPAENEIFIDIDREEDTLRMYYGYEVIKQFYSDAKITRYTPSPSGKPGHFHVVINLGEGEKLKESERLILQASCGSDPKREILGFMHLARGERQVSRFFEKKENNEARAVQSPDREIPSDVSEELSF